MYHQYINFVIKKDWDVCISLVLRIFHGHSKDLGDICPNLSNIILNCKTLSKIFLKYYS